MLDRAVLERLRDEVGDADGAIVLDVIDLFLVDAPKRLAEVRHGLVDGVPECVERGAHTLKGSSANLGAVRLARQCELLEADLP